jgi:ACR3 family arsenite transporter
MEVRIAIPFVIYFTLMFVEFHGWEILWPTILKGICLQPQETISIGYSCCHRVFGINSGQAFAGVIGPLVEVPALIALVNVAFGFEKYYQLRRINQIIIQ